MNIHKILLTGILAQMLITGCTTLQGNLYGEAQPIALSSIPESKASQAQHALSSILDQKSYTQESIYELQQLKKHYRSLDGKYEVALLSAIGMVQLELNERYGLQETAIELSALGDPQALPSQGQFVLSVAKVLKGAEPPKGTIGNKVAEVLDKK